MNIGNKNMISDFATRVKKIREDNNLSGEEFALLFGLKKGAVSVWETKRGYPKVEILMKIADYFNVSVSYLLGYDTEPNELINLDGLNTEQLELIKALIEAFKEKNNG